jgi:hypothetical protein
LHLICHVIRLAVSDIFPPPPGYSIALLGFLGVIMALRISKEPGKGEKAFWIGISFFLMFVKMWAIGHDRHVQDVKYQDEANQRQTQFDATVDRLKSIDVHVIDIPASNAHVDWSVLLQSKPHIPQVSEAER